MTRPTFKEALTELVESPDPLLESVTAYHEGTLGPSERADFEARLESDPQARELLDELSAFEDALEDVEDRASEFEVASTMRAVRRRSKEEPSPPLGQAPVRRWVGIAAILALVSLGLGVAWLDVRQDLLDLQAKQESGFEAVQIHYLTGSEVRGSDGSEPRLSGDLARQILVVTPSEPPEAGRVVSCSIARAGSEEILVGPFEAVIQEHGLVVLSLERDLPSAGDYELILRASDGPKVLERFRFQWRPSPP